MPEFNQIIMLTQWFNKTEIKVTNPVGNVVFMQKHQKIGNLTNNIQVPISQNSQYVSPLSRGGDNGKIPHFYPLDGEENHVKTQTNSTLQIAYILKDTNGDLYVRCGNGHYHVKDKFIEDDNAILKCDNGYYFVYNIKTGAFVGNNSSLAEQIAIKKIMGNLIVRQKQIRTTENGGSTIHRDIKLHEFQEVTERSENLEFEGRKKLFEQMSSYAAFKQKLEEIRTNEMLAKEKR